MQNICNYCVMDTSTDLIKFNSDGKCNFCLQAEKRIKNEYFGFSDDRQERLKSLVESIRSKGSNSKYDILIGVSGGVDSSYVAYLVKKLNLRPLAVHFDNGWNSELAVKNIELLINKIGIDLYTHVVDWEEFRDIQLSFLKASVTNVEIPTDHGIVALLYKIAAENKIKYIIHGGNISTESIMPEDWSHDAIDYRFLKSIHKKFGKIKIKSFPTISYKKIAWHTLINKIRYVGILNYINYDKEKALQLLEDEFGWRRYEGKHFESIFTRFYQQYILPEKFKFDKRRAHLSSLIVSNQLSREEAMDLLKENISYGYNLDEDKKYICDKLQLSISEFDKIMSLPVKKSDDYPNSLYWMSKLSYLKIWFKNIATKRT